MAKLVTLSAISTIRAGVQFRGEAPYKPGGSIRLLQVRDAKNEVNFEEQELRSLADGSVKTGDFLQLGDIVVRAKGKHHPAILIEPMPPQTVASGYCLVLSPLKIRPAFLAWYLNQASAQQYMDQHSIGTVIPILNKKVLGEMQIPLPDEAMQERIASIYLLQLEEKRKRNDLHQLYEMQRESLNQQIISSMEH